MDMLPYFWKLNLSGQDSEDGDSASSDVDRLVRPTTATNMQLIKRKRRFETMIAAGEPKNGSTSELDEEVLSRLLILLHFGVGYPTLCIVPLLHKL